MSGTPDDANDHGLAAALAAHPHARVTAITPEGNFCPMPPELGATQEVLEAETVFEVVPPSEWGIITAGWVRVLEHGSYVGSCLVNDGTRVSMLAYDAREPYGVVILLVIDDATIGDQSTDDQLPMVARFGTYRRDVLANVLDADEGAVSLLGWTAEELAARSTPELIHPEDQANSTENWMTTLSSPGTPQRWRGRHQHRDGSYRWIEFTNTNRINDLGYVISEMMDISEEMATAEALREQRELLARLNDALPLGVCQIGIDREVVYANNQLYELVGMPPGARLSEAVANVHPDDVGGMFDALDAVLGQGGSHTFEMRLRRPDGDERTCLVNTRDLRDAAGAVTGAVLAVSDITESVRLRHELERRATFDLLTGCLNRAATMASLEQLMAAGRAAGRGTAVIFVDLDRFKPVNDSFGHAAGDQLLAHIGRRLRNLVRDGDVVGRVGGDEFLVVCPATAGAEDALPVARRIVTELAEPLVLRGEAVTIGASVGVAWTDEPDATPDSLVAAADDAMYRSKRSGRSEVVLAG